MFQTVSPQAQCFNQGSSPSGRGPRDTGLKEELIGSVLSFGQICEMNTIEEWERGVPECRWGSEKDGGHVNGGFYRSSQAPSPSGTIHTGGGGH